MAIIKPFKAWRPAGHLASKTAALPYDVYNREEARAAAQKEPLSFLNIDRPETQFAPDKDMYADDVYEKASEMLKLAMENGTYIQDDRPCYYLYELTMNGHSQTGLVACASVDDYLDGTIKKHENTRADKEADRIRHVDVCSAQTGPIFLAYHADKAIDSLVDTIKKEKPVYDFISEDGIGHRCWIIDDAGDTAQFTDCFAQQEHLYIADGHHRAASAVKTGLQRREKHKDFTGAEEFNSFLSVIFPDDQLNILPYYRVIRDLNGYTPEQILAQIETYFDITFCGQDQVSPDAPYTYGFYLDHQWYKLQFKKDYIPENVVDRLDVSVLQNLILEPIFGIRDPKTDKRIDFVGGIRGIDELERRCHTDMAAAFSLYPTSMAQLFDVADAGMLMPPKSTWFEPKLRSGLFIHEIER